MVHPKRCSAEHLNTRLCWLRLYAKAEFWNGIFISSLAQHTRGIGDAEGDRSMEGHDRAGTIPDLSEEQGRRNCSGSAMEPLHHPAPRGSRRTHRVQELSPSGLLALERFPRAEEALLRDRCRERARSAPVQG